MSVVLELFCIPHIYSVTEVLITCNCLDDIVMYKWTITTRKHKKQSNRAEFCTWFFGHTVKVRCHNFSVQN